MLYTCIIPCYNSEKSLEQVVDNLKIFFTELNCNDYEIILVNDCSKDNTIHVIKKIVNQNNNVIGLDLARNAGQHNALLAGMSEAKGEYVISLDDDMQTHPKEISKLISKINEGYDVVYASYDIMKQSFFRNFGASFNDYTIRLLVNKPKELKASSYWIAKRFVVDEIMKSKSNFTNLQGLFLRTTNKIVNVKVVHYSRKYGSSNYTLKKLLRLWASCLNYSYLPIRIPLILGFFGLIITSLIILILCVFHLFQPILDFKYYFMINIIFFIASLIMFNLGICAEYIVRMFMVISKEPQYVIKDKII